MPRSASPPYNFSVPSGTAAVSGAIISSTSYNAFLADLTNNALNAAWPVAYGGTGTTDGSALVPDGGAATPSVRFQQETNTGFYRPSAGELDISILGTKRFALTASGLTVTGTVSGTNTRMRTNRWWSPSMEVSQQNGNTLGTTNGYFIADSLAMYFVSTGGAVSGQRIQSVRSLNGSINQAQWKCTTINASPGSTNFDTLTGKLEGLDVEDLQWGTASAIPATISFNWTSPAGTYNVHLQNRSGNRHIAIPFTPTAANTEERITVGVPADTSGTWTIDNDTLVSIDFMLVVGSNFIGGSASTWGSSAFYAAAVQFNSRSSTSNTINVTDISFSPDPSSSGVGLPWVPVDYAAVLAKCQRYLPAWSWANTEYIGLAQAYSTTAAILGLPLPVQTRGSLTGLSALGTFNGFTSTLGGPNTFGTVVFYAGSKSQLSVNLNSGSGLVAGNAVSIVAGATTTLYGTGARLT